MTALQSNDRSAVAHREPTVATVSGRPRVIHLTTTDMSLDWLLRPQLEAFADAGYDVVCASAPGPHVAALAESGLRHVSVSHLTRAMDPASDLRAFKELLALFRRERPEIVHTHNPKPGVLGRIAARAAGVPHIVNTVHGLYAQPTDGPARRAAVYGLERLAATCSHAELVQNPEDVDTLLDLRIPADRVRLLGNGVDLDRFTIDRLAPGEVAHRRRELGFGPDDVVCGLVGRLVVEKGYREVFAAVHELRDRCPRLKFAVVGPSEPDKADAIAPELMQRAEDDGVVFLGRRDDVEELYPLFDLYALASYREGFPRSAMEAAACGLPLVVTNIRGGRQVVDDGVSGLLVEPRDPVSLANGLEAIAGDDSLRNAMARASYEKSQTDFDQNAQIRVTLETYAALRSSS